MQPLFIISGTYDEYLTWYHENRDTDQQRAAVYVQNGATLTRLHNGGDPHGKFIGTWRKRADIMDILSELIKMTFHNGKLITLYEELFAEQVAKQATKQATITKQKIDELQRIVTDQLMRLNEEEHDRI